MTKPQTEEENIAIAVPYIKRCVAQGISTEVELGRLEGGEAGVREISGEMLTDPTRAVVFMKESVATPPNLFLWSAKTSDAAGPALIFSRPALGTDMGATSPSVDR